MSSIPNHSLSNKSLIFLLTAVGLISFPHARHIPAILFGFFASLLIWRFMGIWRKQWLPNRSVLFLLTIVAFSLLYSQHIGFIGRDAGTAFFMVTLGLKLLEIKGNREIYLVGFLAFVVAASQFLYDQSIMMAIYILSVCAVLLATMMSVVSNQSQTFESLKTSVIIIAQATPIALMIFVLFPRLEPPRWQWLENDHRGKSGLSNILEPGSLNDLSLSDELVFRVSFIGEPPPASQRYWRGPVYSSTDGIRWTASTGNNYSISESPSFSGKAYQYTILQEPQKYNWVFALEMPAKFDSSLKRNNLYQLISRNNPENRSEYQITSYPLYQTGQLNRIEQIENLQLPGPASEKIINLVDHLQGFNADPQIYIRNLLAYFHNENFSYTLSPPLMTDRPIETFLFESRSGFCSHFATAFVYLLRAANIPARVVGGYQGGQFNKLGGFFEVRQADAHAWAEVWLEDQGWVRFDPTAAVAPERIEQGVNIDLQISNQAVNFSPIGLDAASLSWLKRTRQLLQSLDYSWQRLVIHYDSAAQLRILEKLGLDDWLKAASYMTAFICVFSGLLAWILLKPPKSQDKVHTLFQRYCKKMAKAGIEINQGEGPRDFAERAKIQRPDLSLQIEQITVVFIRLRYEAKSKPDDFLQFKRLIGSLTV